VAIADNAPHPSLQRIAQNQRARYLPHEKNRGFAAAANSAARHLTADAVLFLNPDAYLERGALAPARQYLAGQKNCGAVGLVLSTPAGTPELRSFGQAVTPLSVLTRHFASPRLPTTPQAVDWVSGGAVLIRRRAWQEVRGFDEDFFLYWEDVDLCRRLKTAGWDIALLPRPGAIHRRGASLTSDRARTLLYDQSADKYFAKHYAKTICLLLRFLRFCYRRLLPSPASRSSLSPG
jgi:GT2 family glycosyltransferase